MGGKGPRPHAKAKYCWLHLAAVMDNTSCMQALAELCVPSHDSQLPAR